MVKVIKRRRDRDRQTETERERQTDRQIDRKTERQRQKAVASVLVLFHFYVIKSQNTPMVDGSRPSTQKMLQVPLIDKAKVVF